LSLSPENKLRENIDNIINEVRKEKSSLLSINQELKYKIETITIDLNSLRDDLESVKSVHNNEIREIDQDNKLKLQKLEKSYEKTINEIHQDNKLKLHKMENSYKDELKKSEERNLSLKNTIENLKEDLNRCEDEIGDHIQLNKILETSIKSKEYDIQELIKSLEEKDNILNNENMKNYYKYKEQEVHKKYNYY